MVKLLILIAAACLRALISHGLGLPIEAKVAELLPFTPHWACDAVTIFLAVLVVEALWLLAEHVMKLRRSEKVAQDATD